MTPGPSAEPKSQVPGSKPPKQGMYPRRQPDLSVLRDKKTFQAPQTQIPSALGLATKLQSWFQDGLCQILAEFHTAKNTAPSTHRTGCCHHCGLTGHWRPECPYLQQTGQTRISRQENLRDHKRVATKNPSHIRLWKIKDSSPPSGDFTPKDSSTQSQSHY